MKGLYTYLRSDPFTLMALNGTENTVQNTSYTDVES